MVFNTITVGTAVTSTVIETYFSHYLNRKPLSQKPTAHISYHEGVNIIRHFLAYASHHTVEDIQNFTSQWVPCPRWIKVDEVTVPQKNISEAADALIAQLGHHGVDKVGGEQWWQWRREGSTLQAEWIEMRRDYTKRKATGQRGERVMLYVHGGAYFFGSVNEHRYQLQRHARKLEARVLARMLVILRDQGFPLPAGAILISPWVDLTHSFPSVAGDSSLDYIPAHGFLHRPSTSWPPPNADDMEDLAVHAVEQITSTALPRKSSQAARDKVRKEAIQGFSADLDPRRLNPSENADNTYRNKGASNLSPNRIPGAGHDLSIMIDGNLVTLKDQIHMYTTNQCLSHPLVSPVLQPSLGGLPPLLILTGGGEILRDEQIFLAHKAANPAKYPPGEAYLDEHPEARELISKWKPTDVQLQVWDDLCHVAPTLSFTRPAKHMYRSIAQFGAWVLARAQKTEIQIMDDDEVSIISASDTESDDDLKQSEHAKTTVNGGVTQGGNTDNDRIGRAGQPLPAFKNHMIRQRVDRHGRIYPLAPPSSLPALQMSANEIGVIKPGPVQNWLNAKKDWDSKYAREKRKVQKQRKKKMAKGYQGFGDDEVPPPSALAGRRGLSMPKEEKKKRSWGMSLWALWGSTHDEHTINREDKADNDIATSTVTETDGANSMPAKSKRGHAMSRSKSRRRSVADTGQANGYADENTSAAELEKRREETSQTDGVALDLNSFNPLIVVSDHSATEPNGQASSQSLSPNANRPKSEGIAFPFKLSTHFADDGRNASTVTLQSQAGVVPPQGDEETQQLGKTIERGTEEVQHEDAYASAETPQDETAESDHKGRKQAHESAASTATKSAEISEEEPAESDQEGRKQAQESAGSTPTKIAETPDEETAESDLEPWKQAAQDKKMRMINGGDDQEFPGEQRRGTLEDVQGVLHYGPKGFGVGKGKRRPELDRAETASLD